MNQVPKSQLFKWMVKYPLLGRAFAMMVLVFFPFIILFMLVVEHWREVRFAWRETVAVAFLPWSEGRRRRPTKPREEES